MSETPRTLQRLESIKVMDKPRDGGRSVIREVVCVYADELTQLERALAKLRQLVAQQAEDDGLWFNAATAPEAYLQQELRKLHAAIEETK